MEDTIKKLNHCFEEMGILPTALTDSAHLTKDLGLDSLDVTDLMLRIESVFAIQISDTELSEFQTIKDIKTYLNQRVFAHA
ncbi:acyl carrier protein [Emticicia sp. TH156]|uniref:acyl carrier protein n=1 Tax=Emticicia sp. TH156 TaxID=2067454 RepID=UPI000C77BA35|nr:acyl carrier protein [Emticicia sp. TH156]PLK42129.1 phosphopantetheine-binding protein [Emticicia sp. TH156]